MAQTAPYRLTVPQDLTMPTGSFLLPVCTTPERLTEILSALKRAEIYTGESIDSKIDILEALAWIENPCEAPCMSDCADNEDTITDNIADFIDGVVNNFQEGGAIRAIGYAITELGRVVIETAVRVIGTTVIGLAVASTVSILIGGVVAGTVAVGAGEVVEVIFDTGSNTSKIVEFVYEVAA